MKLKKFQCDKSYREKSITTGEYRSTEEVHNTGLGNEKSLLE